MNGIRGTKAAVRRIAVPAAACLLLIWIAPSLSAALIRVPNPVLMAAATEKVKPDYSDFAKTMRAEGQVEVDVIVSPDGVVKDARPVSGHVALRDNAKAAALKWKFDPAKLHYDQDVIGTLVFSFKINN